MTNKYKEAYDEAFKKGLPKARGKIVENGTRDLLNRIMLCTLFVTAITLMSSIEVSLFILMVILLFKSVP